FLDQFEPGSASYNVPSALRLRGTLDVAALERALAGIVRRHEALRTVFAAGEAEPVQVIAPDADLSLQVEPVADEEQAKRRVHEEGFRPLDLARGPLFRAHLFRLADDDHVLLVVMHHAVSDGWSMGVLYRELSALYAAALRGEEAALEPLPVQYADYAVWQREHLAGGELERQLAWWKERLAGAPALLEVPTDRPRTASQGHHGGGERIVLPPELAEAIHALGRSEGASLFMTLLAAWQVLLARCSGQDDVVVGSPIAGRTAGETEGLIGFFINTVALRTDLSGDPTFRQLLQRVREGTLEAYARQHLPFEKLVEEVQPERSLTHSPVFQAFFNLLNDGEALPELAGMRAERFGLGDVEAKYDLSLGAVERPEGLTIGLSYRTALFDAATIRRHLEQLRVLLEGIAADADRRLSALPLLTEDERSAVVHAWNRTEAPYPSAAIHRLFEEQAARTPGAVALVDGGATVTYGELEARANRVAHLLLARGVGPEERVGVMLERGAELVAALLGVLKAGGCWLALDPEYPEERLAYMVRDAGAALVLTRQSLRDRLDAPGAETVCLDAEAGALAAQPAHAPGIYPPPQAAAYAIYTSGSTGVPKGVLGTHAGAVNRFAWMWDAYPFQPGEVCCHKTAINFVDSVWEIFGPLLRGVPAVVVPARDGADVAALVRLLAEHRVTRIVLVPSLLAALLDAEERLGERLPALRLWVCSGEALPAALAARFRRACPAAVLLNLYGSSEVAADATAWELPAEDGEGPVPIGAPIANLRV
ncbi:MAG TPA: condensation domain-containing protein, partial [Longimicrobium sp.]|nr:condensation domain-containing protein [Longimicrobium sp.]